MYLNLYQSFKMPVTTRSSFRKPSSNTATTLVNINAKGHPTVGHLTPRPLKSQQEVNCYLEKCTSLETTCETFSNMVNIINYLNEQGKRVTTRMEIWCEEVYQKLYDYVNREIQPTFDEIDSMLLVCRVLIKNKMKDRLQEFILNCPKKFIITYSNNSERTPAVLYELDKLGLGNIRAYLIAHIHETKLGTWNERRNTHKRGNTLLECTI